VRAAALLAGLLVPFAPQAHAAGETLFFTRIDVRAQLADDGSVSVSETHDIAVGRQIQDFTWDVGLAADQSLVLRRLVRVLDDGSERELPAGEPTRTESYFLGRAWLRIGLKNAEDTIAGERRVYRIEYEVKGGLSPSWDLPAGSLPLDVTRSEYVSPLQRFREVRNLWLEAWPDLDRHYRIDHDVLFPSRAGPAFALGQLNYDLEWDKRVWRLLHPERDAGRATPGTDYRVQRTLEYLKAGRPAAVDRRAPGIRVASLAAVAAAGLVLWLLLLVVEGVRNLRQPRFDPAHFESVVASRPPDLLRSLFGGQPMPPDTDTLLLRMAAERKLQIRVTQPSTDDANARTELRLLVDRSELRDHEAALISALFDPGVRETTTERVQARYKGSEFDPDTVIAEAFASQPVASQGQRPLFSLLRLALAGAGLVLGIRDLQATAAEPYALGAGLVAGGGLGLLMPSAWWRGLTVRAALALLIPIAILSAAVVPLALIPNRPLGADASLALALLMASHIAGYLAALPRPAGQNGPLLEQLWRARRWAAAELRRERPRLRDTWIAHLEALDLSRPLEAWRRRHGGAPVAAGGIDLAAIESGEALSGPAFSGNAPSVSAPSDEDWSSGFWVWEGDEQA